MNETIDFKMSNSNEMQRIEQQALANTCNYVQRFHSNFDEKKGKQLAKLYFCASDQDGFCLNFDDVWQIVGYSRKNNAKAKLTSRKLGLVDGQDYKISVLNLKHQVKHGGHNREDIWLTARAFSQFALAAQTDQGVALRDFLQYLTVQVKNLMTNLQSGKVRLTAGGQTEDERAANRLKACASQKSLTGVLDSIKFTTGQTYFRVNGETNRMVTGKTKRELVKELDEAGELGTKKLRKDTGRHKKGEVVKRTAKDVNHRDYFSKKQLAAAELGEMFSADTLAEAKASGELQSDIDVLQSHRKTFQGLFTPEALEKLQNDKRPSKLTVQQAKRVNGLCIQDAPEKRKRKRKAIIDKKQKSMTQYFGSKV